MMLHLGLDSSKSSLIICTTPLNSAILEVMPQLDLALTPQNDDNRSLHACPD